MKTKVKFLLPLMLVLSLAGCNDKKTSTSIHSPSVSTGTSVPPSTSVIPPTSDATDVNLLLDFDSLTAGSHPDLKDDWESTFTYTYDKAIVLKRQGDYILTPPFKTTKKLNVAIKGFLETGSSKDDTFEATVQGLGEDGTVIDTVTLKEKDITGKKDTPVQFSVAIPNTSGKVRRIKIAIAKSGRVTNFGITHLEIKSA